MPSAAPTPAAGAPTVPSRPQEDLDRDLHEIYAEDDGADKRDMSRLDQADHSRFRRILVGITAFCSVLAAISWAGFFFFSSGREKFVGQQVAITIEGPTEVKSGESVSYAVRWKNGESVPLGTASLEIRLPDSFAVSGAEPAAGSDGRWLIGSVIPGADGMIKIDGTYLAPIDKEMDIQAILTYRPADFNSEFQKVETKTVKVTDSVLDLTIAGPAKVLPGDKVTLALSYENTSQNGFQDVRVRGVWPDSFIPDGSDVPATDEKLDEWKIDALPAGGKGTINVTGTFASGTEGATDVKAQIGFLGKDEAFQMQKEADFATTVLHGDLLASLILNGKTDDQPLRYGDMLRYAVTYKNTGTVTLEDVTLAVTIAPSDERLVSWNDLQDRAKGTRDGDVITWTKKQIPSLARIDGGGEGTIDFELPVAAAPLPDAAPGAVQQIVSSLEARVVTIDGAVVNRSAKTPPMTARFVSDTALAAYGRYFNPDGVPIGSGPLPPEVGKPTTYRITWHVTNSLHELSDLRLSAKLPSNAEWTGHSSVDAGNLSFDAGAEKMVWTLNWMPTTIKALDISFDVRLTPLPGDKGGLPMIADAAIFEAIDKATGDAILLTAPPVTTALDGDTFAAGKGRVQ